MRHSASMSWRWLYVHTLFVKTSDCPNHFPTNSSITSSIIVVNKDNENYHMSQQ